MTAAPTITRNLSKGSRGTDVKELQAYLAGDTEVYPEGDATGFFGPATQRAIGRFQVKYGLAKPGDPGYGEVGPKTRAKLKELKTAPAASAEASLTATVTASPKTDTSALNKQIEEALKQIEELQKKLDSAKTTQ